MVTWELLLVKMFLWMLSMIFRKVDLSFEKLVQWRRKWGDVSISLPQLQIGLSESWKRCFNLCSRRWYYFCCLFLFSLLFYQVHQLLPSYYIWKLLFFILLLFVVWNIIVIITTNSFKKNRLKQLSRFDRRAENIIGNNFNVITQNMIHKHAVKTVKIASVMRYMKIL